MSAVQAIGQESFEQEVLSSSLPVLIDFWAPWCGPCRMLAPTVDEIAAAYEGRIKVVKINVDDEPALAQRFGVMSIPTLVYVKDGQEAGRAVGVKPRAAIEAMFV